MNIIRTSIEELTIIPALAYKYKLKSGGAGIKLIRLDCGTVVTATLDKRTGEAKPYGKFNNTLFPTEAFQEAVELFSGKPYTARGNVVVSPTTHVNEDEQITEEVETKEQLSDMTNSDEYIAILDMYTDEKGRLNYKLMNKQFIQFANKSKLVANMITDKVDVEDIIVHVVKNRAAYLTNKKKDLSEIEVKSLIATLDEIRSPKTAFKDLKAHINRMYTRL